MNKKGFTLVELLAVFILLGIIVGIAFKVTDDLKDQSKLELVKTSAKNLFTAVDNYYADNDYKNFPTSGLSITELDLQSTSFTSGKVKLDSTGHFTLVNVTDGDYCINGTIDSLDIVKEKCATAPVAGATRAYVIIYDGEGNQITNSNIADLPSAYSLESGAEAIIYYVNEGGFLVASGEGIAASTTNEQEVNSFMQQMPNLIPELNIANLHYYINTKLGFSYILNNICDPSSTCDGKSFNLIEILTKEGTTVEEMGFIIIDF